MDQQDELRVFRSAFMMDDPRLIYMDGNSLGRLPRKTTEVVQAVTEAQWGQRLIRSWNEGWYQAPRRLGDKIGRLVGAQPGEVIVSDSTSLNLYKLAMAALRLRPERPVVLSDRFNFPTDLYILQGCLQTLKTGQRLELLSSPDGVGMDSQAVLAAITEETALVVLSQVVFKSGYLYDVEAITRRAHAVGALVLWDLSHAAGAVPVALDEWQVDFAVGCTYKYLNGGPGAPAFLYVRQDLQAQVVSPVWGWFGDRTPFAFDLSYEPAEGIERFLAGTPPMLSLLAMEPGLDLLIEAGMDRVRAKSVRQTDYLIRLADAALAPLEFTVGSPREAERRGSHVSLRHPEGYRINRALIEEMQVLPDFREPDNLRLGIAPLYTSFAEIWETVQRTARVAREGLYKKYPAQREAVT